MNLVPSLIETGPRVGKIRLINVPGLRDFKTVGRGPIRGIWSNIAACYVVSGGEVIQIFNDATPNALLGPIANDPHPALITSNGFQLAFASGGKAYIAPGAGFGVIPIVDTEGDPVNAQSIAFMNEYFIVAIKDTKQVMVSNLAPDGGTWDPANVAIKEGYSDNIVRLWVDEPGGQYLWLFGNDTLEIWVPTADFFPFQRMQGGLFSIGCDSPWSVAGVAGWRGWLWHGVIWGCSGFQPARVSDAGVEAAIATYSNYDQENAEAFSYIDGQHAWYIIAFPVSGDVWAYDINLKMWHRRQYFSNGAYGRYRPRCTTRAFGKQLVGDYANNKIYALDPKVYTDAGGAALRRQRTCPYVVDGPLNNDRYNRLTIDMDTGVGLPVAADQPGYDPQVVMKYSINRGKTWSNERQVGFGRLGEVDRRVIFPQLGASRIGATVDIVVTDPVPVNINGAYFDIGKGTWPRP